MKVTVRDCLKQQIFKDAKVIAGENGLDARVRAVSVLESGETDGAVPKQLRGEEMIITSFFSVRDDVKKQCDALRMLSKEKEAAVVLFNVGTVLTNVDPEVIRTADEIGLPFIVMPESGDVAYADVISAVMENLLYGDAFDSRLISNTIFHLLNFERHGSFQAAVREAAINNNFQIIILSEDFNPIFSVETRHRASIDDAIRLGIEREVDKTMICTMIDVDGAVTYWGPISINGEKKYYLVIVDNEDEYSQGEMTKLAEILELAMGMWKYSPVRDAKAELIKALRRGNKSLAYSLKEEAQIDGERILSAFCVIGVEKDSGFKVITAFEKKENMKILKISEDEEICGIVLTESESRASSDCNELYEELERIGTAVIFHVTGLDGVEGAADAFQVINEAWPFIQQIFPHQKTFTKYELALASNCVNISLKGGLVKKNYMDLLEPFKEASENKGKQLLETLEIFVLDAGMNTAKTAKMMQLHSNTVQYRLKKIKEILGVDIMENTVIPALMTALAIERIGKIVKPF